MTDIEQNLDFMGFDDLAKAPPTVPDGEYTVRAVDGKRETSKNTGNEYVGYSVIVQAGPHAGHRIFNGIISLKPDNLWRFKRDTEAIGLEFPGMSVREAADALVQMINSGQVEFVAQIGSRPRQVKDDSGDYVDDPEGSRQNTVKRWVGPAL